MKRNRFLRGMRFALFAALALAAVTLVVMTLWNLLLPGIFGVHAIGFWQALGLLVLSKILFGGFRPGTGGGMRWRRRMRDRWDHMTPDQRETFKQGMRGMCGRVNREAEVKA